MGWFVLKQSGNAFQSIDQVETFLSTSSMAQFLTDTRKQYDVMILGHSFLSGLHDHFHFNSKCSSNMELHGSIIEKIKLFYLWFHWWVGWKFPSLKEYILSKQVTEHEFKVNPILTYFKIPQGIRKLQSIHVTWHPELSTILVSCHGFTLIFTD